MTNDVVVYQSINLQAKNLGNQGYDMIYLYITYIYDLPILPQTH